MVLAILVCSIICHVWQRSRGCAAENATQYWLEYWLDLHSAAMPVCASNNNLLLYMKHSLHIKVTARWASCCNESKRLMLGECAALEDIEVLLLHTGLGTLEAVSEEFKAVQAGSRDQRLVNMPSRSSAREATVACRASARQMLSLLMSMSSAWVPRNLPMHASYPVSCSFLATCSCSGALLMVRTGVLGAPAEQRWTRTVWTRFRMEVHAYLCVMRASSSRSSGLRAASHARRSSAYKQCNSSRAWCMLAPGRGSSRAEVAHCWPSAWCAVLRFFAAVWGWEHSPKTPWNTSEACSRYAAWAVTDRLPSSLISTSPERDW